MAFSKAISESLLSYDNTKSNTVQINSITSQNNTMNNTTTSPEFTRSAQTSCSNRNLFQSSSSEISNHTQLATFDCNNNHSISTYASNTINTTSPGSYSGLNLNTNHQSSKGFGYKPKTPNQTNISMIPKCPNMVCNKCRCKDILKQNKAAQKIWSGCYRINVPNTNYKNDNREVELAYFDMLYNQLSKYFKVEVDSDRIPKKYALCEAINYFGGFTINNNSDVVIDRCHFISFWKWFRGVTNIIKDIYQLWDVRFPFQLNLFMNRQECQAILERAPQGTVVLRLSKCLNGLVVSYSESTFNRYTKIKHLLLKRQSEHNYMTKTNNNSHKSCSLDQLIRTFVKLQFIYTPNYIYKKNHVF